MLGENAIYDNAVFSVRRYESFILKTLLTITVTGIGGTKSTYEFSDYLFQQLIGRGDFSQECLYYKNCVNFYSNKSKWVDG